VVDLPLAIAVLCLATVASSIQSLSGFGFSLFIVPILAVMLGPRETVFIANVLSVVLCAAQLWHMRSAVEWRTSSLLLIGSFLGMPFGVAVLLVLDPAILKLLIAGTVVVFTLLLIRGLRLHGGGKPGDIAIGFVSGVFNTSTSMSGPPVVIYLQGKRIAPMAFRATNTFFFGVSAVGAVAMLSLSGASSVDAWLASAIALPGVALGRIVGNASYRRINEVVFRRIVFSVLLGSAAVAVLTTLLG
jgi:uncharacterized membrane protein YfcA